MSKEETSVGVVEVREVKFEGAGLVRCGLEEGEIIVGREGEAVSIDVEVADVGRVHRSKS